MRYSLVLLFVSFTLLLVARDIFPVPQMYFEPNSYICHRTMDNITVDGKLTEASWQHAVWTEDFEDIEGSLKPIPSQRTHVKMLWDDNGLYVAAELFEKQIWATLKEHDSVIFHDNDFEIFIDPDGDTHDYYEIEVNALNTIWDLFLIKPYRDRDQVAVNAWDIAGLQSAIGIDGTLNNPTDTDTKWTVEMMLPWKVLSECAHMPCPPHQDDQWRMNFSRVEWQTIVKDGAIIKQTDANGNTLPESNWVWSPQGLIAMHYPECWGFVQFSTQPVDSATDSYKPSPLDAPSFYLRILYYKQKQYYMDHQKYARALNELDATPYKKDGKTINPRIETTSLSYIITLPATKEQPALHIREDGLLWRTAD